MQALLMAVVVLIAGCCNPTVVCVDEPDVDARVELCPAGRT